MISSKPKYMQSRFGSAFTLMETVIAIGVVAVLLSGFVAVFAPAAQGIRKSINSQQADRLATTLENELVTLREGQQPTNLKVGFNKAFEWIKDGGRFSQCIFVYQYRGSTSEFRDDGTPEPVTSGQPGVDYTVQSIARRVGDQYLDADFEALEGTIFYVKTEQLVFNGGALELSGNSKAIVDPQNPGPEIDSAEDYPDAVITFSAEFYSVPTKTITYLESEPFRDRYNDFDKPEFTRNLAVRR